MLIQNNPRDKNWDNFEFSAKLHNLELAVTANLKQTGPKNGQVSHIQPAG